MYIKNKTTIRELLEIGSQKNNPWGDEIKLARQEMELAQKNFNQARGAWIDVCAHALCAAELKYQQLLRMAKAEEPSTP